MTNTKKKTYSYPAKKKKDKPSPGISLPIVGIGASAGGIEALTQLFHDFSNNTGFSFVIILHLDPAYKSTMVEIISRVTSMPVVEIQKNLTIKPNHVYVIPPKYDVTLLNNNKFKLKARTSKRVIHTPIDTFFTSLAEVKKNKCVGIILSGTGTDGTLGMQAIKGEGGINFVQKPTSAKYDAMPKNAIRAGVVDSMLAPKEMAKEIIRIATHPYVRPTFLSLSEEDNVSDFEELPQDMSDALGNIITTLRKVTHLDFAQYKMETINRRIKRRILLCKAKDFESYAKYIRHHHDEAKALANDFLITVTRFFRDKEVFEALKKKILPDLIKNHDNDTPIRIWVPGCASGEEAYSLAIILLEILEKKRSSLPIRIFATDISEPALQQARGGFYPETIARDVSPERLNRFFTRVEDGYRISKLVREQCIFSYHDLTRDPPFAKIDLISCRNLLIYFNVELQKRVIPIFYYALKDHGVLVLGHSEATSGFSKLFNYMDKKNRIYTKKDPIGKIRPHLPFAILSSKPIEQFIPSIALGNNKMTIQKEADRFILEKYAPPCVLINSHMDIVMTRGDTWFYLGLPSGQPSLNIMKMASLELAMEIRHAVQVCKKSSSSVEKKNIFLKNDREARTITLRVEPLKIFSHKEEYFLIEFIEDTNVQTIRQKTAKSIPRQIRHSTSKADLMAERHYQSLLEQFESAQEEMTASNEELQSSNEELQSTNEELETAKEELQSSNEELSTVNDELFLRNTEITQLNKDLNNLFSNIDIPIILVDDKKYIRHFTPSTSNILNLIVSDIGRPLVDIKSRLKKVNLERMLTEVMTTLTPKIVEVQNDEDVWYELIIKPYKSIANKVEGAVIILLNIDDLKRATEEINKSYQYSRKIIETLPTPLLLIDEKLNIIEANQAFCKTFHLTENSITNKSFSKVSNGIWNIPDLLERIKITLFKNINFKDFEVEHDFRSIGYKFLLLSARQIRLAGNKNAYVLLAIQDITERKQIEYKLLYEKLALALNVGKIGTWEYDLKNNILKWDNGMREINGLKPSPSIKINSEIAQQNIHRDDLPKLRSNFDLLIKKNVLMDLDYRVIFPSGEMHYIRTRATAFPKSNKIKQLVIGVAWDITEAKLLSNQLLNEKETLLNVVDERNKINKELENFAYVASHDLKAPLRGIQSLTSWIEKDNENKLSDDSKENLQLLRNRVDRMSNLVEGILEFTHANKIDLNVSTVSVKNMLDEVIDSISPTMTFKFHYPNDLPIFKTAKVPLTQVFSNLISNAVKHNNKINGIVTIGVNDKGDFYEFFVKDNGPGIDIQYHKKIFQMFQTLEGKEDARNTGIGLSIVKRIVELNQGKVRVKSELGKGSIFYFTWPKHIKQGKVV